MHSDDLKEKLHSVIYSSLIRNYRIRLDRNYVDINLNELSNKITEDVYDKIISHLEEFNLR